MTITREQIEEAASGLSLRDFAGFANAIKAIDPVLARTVELHAEAADGNSPDVAEWIDGTMQDAEALAKMNITTRSAARVYWMVEYTDSDPSADEAAEMFRAVYGRDADDSDREVGVFSLVCAGVR